MVQRIGEGYRPGGNIPDSLPRTMEQNLQFSTGCKKQREDVADEAEEAAQLMIAMQVLLPVLPPLGESVGAREYLIDNGSEIPKNPCLPVVETFSEKQGFINGKTLNPAVDDLTRTTSLMPQKTAKNDAAMLSFIAPTVPPLGNPTELGEHDFSAAGNHAERSGAISDDVQEQIGAVSGVITHADSAQLDNGQHPFAEKAATSLLNSSVAAQLLDPGIVRADGWHYKFRSWGGRHQVRISNAAGLHIDPDLPENSIDLSASSRLVAQRLNHARASFESDGKWLLQVHDDGERQSHSHQRLRNENKGDE